MDVSEGSVDLPPLRSGGEADLAEAAVTDPHADSVLDGCGETQHDKVAPKPELLQLKEPAHSSPASQNGGIKQNGSLRPLAPSSTSHYSPLSSCLSESPKLSGLLPAPLLHHCAACCPFPESVCCCGNPQEAPLFQGSVHGRTLHMDACCVQATPCFCMHNYWQQQQHFQNQPKMGAIRSGRSFRFPKSYAELIADWPVVVLGVCTVLIVTCTLVGVLVPELPDFSDPLLGFEPRGTTIGQRLVTWNNMVKNTGYKATLANYPFKYADEQAKSHQEDRWSEDRSEERTKRQAEWDFSVDHFFCDVPGDGYSRIVFTSADGKSLWNIHAMKSMCSFDNTRVRSHPQYWNLCQRTTNSSCCPSWTLGNYVAVLSNRSSCQTITERDVAQTLKVLRSCAKYYYNGTLGPECWDVSTRRKDQIKCANVPKKCTKYNAVYQILHFLVDKDFLNPKASDAPPVALRYSMLFSPTEKGDSMMDIYLDNFENLNASDGVTAAVGIEFGIKHNLFQDYLLTDIVYPVIAIVIVLLIMCVYTKSVFITTMTMFAIVSSLIVSYVLYRVVFNFQFFPFMNLTALIILVGVGADDAFVLCDVWNYTKIDKPNSALSETVNVTLQHAALSMFVTSFTTAAAFYANYVSNITAIRCFGVYAGTAILVNYILMVTWLPAVVVLHERYLLNVFVSLWSPQSRSSRTVKFLTSAYQKTSDCLVAMSGPSRLFFEKVLPCVVIKLRYLWLFWFLALTAGGAYVVCVSPKMKLPSLELSEFQVFRSTHPFERYDAEFKKLFMFERVHHGEDLHMPITVIWGVIPVDSGDPLNPKNKGILTLDTGFNIASPASQTWILNFCQKLRNQSFVFQSEEQDFTSCFMETFKQWMENQDCDEAKVYPCCSQSTFPYKQEVFELCIKRAIMELEHSTIYHLDSKTPGPRFDINDTICAIVLEFRSTHHFTLAYEKMHSFYQEVDSWIHEELKSAPEGLTNGWFVSNLEFYDLQDSLSTGSLIAMALSVIVALGVMLLTTWNIIISLYAIISIAGTIFVTVGSLVLLGWELNVLESVTISVAVGLSVDFAVHYGVAYRLAPESDRKQKVVFSLSRMGSAIAMAALTTIVAGAMMMPSTVLAYTQLGTFLMLIMCVSWAFATFFFQCMCCCIGPQGTCGQIPMPKMLQCYAFDPGSASSTASQCQTKNCASNKYQSESEGQEGEYELEPLATNVPSMENPEEQDAGSHQSSGSTGSGQGSDILLNHKQDSEQEKFSHHASCTCREFLPHPHIARPHWTCHPSCIQPKECPCLVPHPPPKGQGILSTLDIMYMSTNHDRTYVHCTPVHFHPCLQPHTPRPGPLASNGCYVRGYGVHTLHLQSLAHPPDSTDTDVSHFSGACSPPADAVGSPEERHDSVQCCRIRSASTDFCAEGETEKSGDTTIKPHTSPNVVPLSEDRRLK